MRVKQIDVQTELKVEVFNLERMVLVNGDLVPPAGVAIAVAERLGGHTWTVTAADSSSDPVTTEDRGAAIDAMYDIALTGGDGYSVLEPNFEINGELIPLRQVDDYIANQGSPE